MQCPAHLPSGVEVPEDTGMSNDPGAISVHATTQGTLSTLMSALCCKRVTLIGAAPFLSHTQPNALR